MLNLTALRTFVVVMRTGSFTGAAKELGYSGSAVSQQMSSFEAVLGLQLFERDARTIRPTPVAEYLKEHSVELLGLIHAVETDMQRLAAGEVGRLRVGSFRSASAVLLPQTIARFLIRRRDVEISLDEGEPEPLFQRVISGEIDVALGFRYDNLPTNWSTDLTMVELFRESLHVVVSKRHRLAGKEQIDLHELRDDVWISPDENTDAFASMNLRASQAGFQPKVAFRINSFPAVLGLVGSGLGVALLPQMALFGNDEVRSIKIAGGLPGRHIVITTSRTHNSPLTKSFVAAAIQVARSTYEFQGTD